MSNETFGTDHTHHRLVEHVTTNLGPAERLAVLETRFEQMVEDNRYIREKLDELVELKHKGLGAVWLIGLVVGTGLIGLANTLFNLINKGHL